jgi:hypothetical protein
MTVAPAVPSPEPPATGAELPTLAKVARPPNPGTTAVPRIRAPPAGSLTTC